MGVNEAFRSSQWEASYGRIRLQPALYQDDIERMVSSLQAAQAGNTFLSSLMESKLLSFNTEKSICLVVGKDEDANQMRTHLTNQPLKLCGKPMKNVMQYTYLGEELHELGVAASAEATINKRYGKVKQLIFEIKSILEDCRLNTVGGASTGLDLWEMSIVPFLYFSSECWVELKKESLKKLKELHLLFYRCLLGCPSTTPSASLFWFLGQLLPENKVIERKLLFLFHVANLPIQTVARQIYEEQRKLGIGGLVSECRTFLAQINVRESLIKTASKSQWKSIIRSGILEKNRYEVLEMCKGLKKVDYFQLKNEDFELKEYFKTLSLKQSRTLFSIKTNMVNAKMNYMSDP